MLSALKTLCFLLLISLTVQSSGQVSGLQNSNGLTQVFQCLDYLDSSVTLRTTSTGEIQVVNGVYQGVAQEYNGLTGPIYGVFFRARVNPSSASNNLKVTVYAVAQGLPGSILSTQNITVNGSSSMMDNMVMFSSPINTPPASVIISVEPLSPFTDDFFVERNTPPDGQNFNLIKLKQANQWFNNLAIGDPSFNYDFQIIPLTQLPVTASFTYSGNNATVNFTNTSTNAVNYEWDFGDGNTSLQTSPQHVYSSSGNYNVKLRAIRQGISTCIDSVFNIITVSVTGLEDVNNSSVIRLTRGNITDNILHLEVQKDIEISIYSISGQITGKYSLKAGGETSLDLSAFDTGTYIIQGDFKPVRFLKIQP